MTANLILRVLRTGIISLLTVNDRRLLSSSGSLETRTKLFTIISLSYHKRVPDFSGEICILSKNNFALSKPRLPISCRRH